MSAGALADLRFSTGLDRSIPPSVPEINVRWMPDMDTDRRRALEERFGLERRNEVAPTTWRYALTDRSRANITSILQHPDVEDTHGLDRAEALLVERYQAPSLDSVPRLYTLALTFTGVAAADLRLEDVDLVFVNTVTGQEVEARRVASHDAGDTPSRDIPTALPAAPAVEAWLAAHPYLDFRLTASGELRLRRGAYRLPEHLVLPRGVQPAHRGRHRPPAWRWSCDARAGWLDHQRIRGPAGDDTTDRARAAVRGGGGHRRWLPAHRSHPSAAVWRQ